jgi:hypothetical protein
MDVDVPGRVKNTRLPHANALAPLFEAIINAVDSLAESTSRSAKEISIAIERDTSQKELPTEAAGATQPIKSFIIQDNGQGFTDICYKAFKTSDTQQKANLGGKGVGRFLWLKGFDHAEIDSVFLGMNGKKYRRHFEFRLTEDGVEGHSLTEVRAGEETTTKVRLCEYKPEYQAHVPRSLEVISRRIIDHCLEHFALGLAPKIIVRDLESGMLQDLNDMFATEVDAKGKVEVFSAGVRQFNLHNLRVSPGHQNSHRLYFCADKRAVLSENLAGRIPNLVGTLRDSNAKSFTYAGYVSGDYLNEFVNSERTDFSIPKEDSLLEPGWNTLVQRASEEAASFLAPYTESVKQAKEQRVGMYVREKAPQYRPVVKHRKDLLDSIPADIGDEKLDLELYKANQVYEADIRSQSSQILESFQKGSDDWGKFESQYGKFLEEWNELGMAKLARHVVHRKATLDFLKESLRISISGKYKLESAIHQLVFPLKSTSDDVRPDQMNLWILDEKLAYHYYLASDIPFNQQEVNIESSARPDIIIFNRPIAFVDEAPPFSAVILVEFKRPARNDYADEENPIAQIFGYVETIKSGKARDHAGRPIAIKADTPIYSYILGDITPTLRRQASYASLKPTPDGLGFFGFNPEVGVWVEVISFDKLLADAEKRNSSLFDQLNIPK